MSLDAAAGGHALVAAAGAGPNEQSKLEEGRAKHDAAATVAALPVAAALVAASRNSPSASPPRLGPAHSEVAEGLTLSPPTDSSGSRSNQQQHGSLHGSGSGSNSNNQQWPLQHLERIKSENKVSALVGHNVILNCAVQFKDGVEKPYAVNWFKYPQKTPIYIWYAGYQPLAGPGYESRVSRLGQASLNLSQVRESDQGLYECEIYVKNSQPEDKASNATWIFLDVKGEYIWRHLQLAASKEQREREG